ncbi:MAG: AraC family transcriptional regulator [Vallitaleaceae bacterium]|nr:AraC family transcriptional regulator [Vallitaleaceae bacterium]
MDQFHAPFFESQKFHMTNDIRGFIAKSITFPGHFHRQFELFYMMKGQVEMSINQEKCLLQVGDLGISLPNDVHSYRSEGETEGILLIFSPEYIVDCVPELEGNDYVLASSFLRDKAYSQEVQSAIKGIFAEVQRDAQEKREYQEAVIKGYINLMFGRILESVSLEPMKREHRKHSVHLQEISRLLQENYERKISLDDIAHEVGLNKYYISHLFKEVMHCSIPDYLNVLRVNRAVHLITTTQSKILDISLDCGFDSQRHFNRVFKEITGATPAQYRNKREVIHESIRDFK